MSGWSTRAPVEFSNRELHRKGGEREFEFSGRALRCNHWRIDLL
jgi:hypothetical protein